MFAFKIWDFQVRMIQTFLNGQPNNAVCYVSTMTYHAYERVRVGKPMPGLFEVSREVPIAQAIEDILLLAECSRGDEWEGQVRYLPLR